MTKPKPFKPKHYDGFEYIDGSNRLCITGLYLSKDKKTLLIDTLFKLMCFKLTDSEIHEAKYRPVKAEEPAVIKEPAGGIYLGW